MKARNPRPRIENHPISDEVASEGERVASEKRQAREAALIAKGQDPRFGDGTMAAQESMEVLSEA